MKKIALGLVLFLLAAISQATTINVYSQGDYVANPKANTVTVLTAQAVSIQDPAVYGAQTIYWFDFTHFSSPSSQDSSLEQISVNKIESTPVTFQGVSYTLLDVTRATIPKSHLARNVNALQFTLSSATMSPTPTATNSPTNSPTNTPTNTPTNSATLTPSPTGTLTFTLTATLTPTNSPTNTPTLTPTNTPTNTPTVTKTKTPNPNQTATATFTPNATSTQIIPFYSPNINSNRYASDYYLFNPGFGFDGLLAPNGALLSSDGSGNTSLIMSPAGLVTLRSGANFNKLILGSDGSTILNSTNGAPTTIDSAAALYLNPTAGTVVDAFSSTVNAQQFNGGASNSVTWVASAGQTAVFRGHVLYSINSTPVP